MGAIHVLDFSVANLIAAGEVVDRPASAVKELLENAIDAGAKSVTVEIKNGGISLIRVTDDGRGMERDDVAVSILRHATSKIQTAADLDGILTLGFRGEALAAIASVSHLRIMTRTADGKTGTLLESYGGKSPDISDCGCQKGTTVIVEELFANVPARRKFLKKDQTEANAVAAVVEKLALSRPDVAFRFLSDGNVRFTTVGDGKLSSAVYAIMGREFVKKLMPVDFMTDGISVQGFIGRPDNVRGNRNLENFFINGRYVKCNTASAALEQAFRSYLFTEKFPCCVLNIRIHPALVDVNVHPTKLEVKFSNERVVFDAVYCAVRNTLVAQMTNPEMKLGGESALMKRGEDLRTAFVPVEDRFLKKEQKEREGDLPKPALTDVSAPAPAPTPSPVTPTIPIEQDSLPTGDLPLSVPKITYGTPVPLPPTHTPAPDAPSPQEPPAVTEREAPAPPQKSEPEKPADSGFSEMTALLLAGLQKSGVSFSRDETTPEEAVEPSAPSPAPASSPAASPAAGVGANPSAVQNPFRRYNILGVAFQTYIIVEIGESVLIVDKHAAHERIIFEEMKSNRAKRTPASQMLLVPYEATMTAEELEALENYRAELESTGFGFSVDYDRHTAFINAVPFGLEEQAPQILLTTIAGQLASGTGSVAVAREAAFEEALYQASCKAAVKAGRQDSDDTIRWICQKLVEFPDIRFCPHGRPVLFELSRHEIEKQFKRI